VAAALTVDVRSLFKLGIQGHIEDVAVIGDQQGKKLGVRLLSALDFIAGHESVGCYKVHKDPSACHVVSTMLIHLNQVILDCSPENEGFYEKCSYEKAGSEMHRYFDAEAEKEGV
jgi:glucosamine-phosphate N-acetyltransferase